MACHGALGLFSSGRAVARTHVIAALAVIVLATTAGVAWLLSTPAPFSMKVASRPNSPLGEQVMSLAGQRCVFLVVVEDEGGWLQGVLGLGQAVSISAAWSAGMADVTIYPQTITPGQVAEVVVTPSVASINQTLTVVITGNRHGLARKETVTVEVLMGEDLLGPYAAEIRDRFVPWLAADHPELGIANETRWTGTVVNPRILIVMHYLFFSDEWEMYVTWHVTIPPHDWTRIYLRHRFTETRPSHAFEISSVKGQETPYAIEVPEWV